MATFVGRPPIPWGLMLLTLISFVFFVVPGVIMYLVVVRRMVRFQNIVVSANGMMAGSEAVITHPKTARKLARRFLAALPALPASTAEPRELEP